MITAGLKIDARRKKIVEQLESTGRVLVSQLSEALGTTPATIRNDLRALELSGQLERVQGGAIAKAKLGRGEGEISLLAEKRAIAEETVRQIANGDTLFINSGTTTLEVARALREHRNLNIVTSSIAIAMELGNVSSFRVILLGGEVNVQYGFTRGGDAQDQLAKYQADHCILTLDGVSVGDGITTYHADEAIIDRMMVEHAKRAVVVADHTKIGRAGFSQICPSDQIDALITDSDCPADELNALRALGVEIIRAEAR